MPYIAPGSSQSCIPRKAVASTVLEQTRRNNAAGKSSSNRPLESSNQASSSKLDPLPKTTGNIDTSAATSRLAETLEVTHIDEPALPVAKSASSSSLAPSSSDPPSDTSSAAVSPTISSAARSQLFGESGDAVNAYRTALYTYTREKLLAAKGPGSPGKKGGPGYSQFGAKQSGMQKLAAKKALARELNA